jgi:hypothetical protein
MVNSQSSIQLGLDFGGGVGILSAGRETEKPPHTIMEPIYEGKAKRLFTTEDPNVLRMEYKDSATAFNGVKKEDFENKGRFNKAITLIIYRMLEEKGVQTHLVDDVDDINLLVKKVSIMPLEVIVRNVAAGSFSKRMGVAEGTEFKKPIVEFSYKDDALNDPFINDDYAREMGAATEEECANKVDLVEDLLDVVGGGSALSDTGDSAALSLKIVRNLYGIEGDHSVEIGESNNKNEEKHGINDSVRAEDVVYCIPEAVLRAINAAKSEDGGKKRYDRGSEDDRHNTGHVELDRKVRALTAVHLSADDLLSILNGNSSLRAGKPDNYDDQCDKECYEHYRKEGREHGIKPGVLDILVVMISVGHNDEVDELIAERGNGCNDISEEYDRNTVTDTALVDSLSKPHNERCTRNVAGYDDYSVEPEERILTCGCRIGKSACVLEKEVVTDSSYDSENHRQDSGDEVHLLLVILCHLAELREDDCKELDDN